MRVRYACASWLDRDLTNIVDNMTLLLPLRGRIQDLAKIGAKVL